mmetsp:Transcript_74878/g.150578  ORF Transcript_74878/g.150578 Transcript_74878/m.150578 type:complete len:177 (+) Transcript_74878:110-640(+)|eukprot:CAMPEP_0171641810 /NCGR_PEP_ID=MMETSP0990-20121206/31484_1 /TAXON_ID=483369 /ORGANISM="non described non described, Strain CCMP2098" /LENGTH=176 /DNA_ID=CAMNT_0012216717 /DNA_START=110 /DNA_END=640 /DNA_ORIENTATION=+
MADHKETLKQLREEKYAAQEQKQYEYQMAANENYAISQGLREGLAIKSRTGEGGVFAKPSNMPIPQPARNKSLSFGDDAGRFEGHEHRSTPRNQASKENKTLDPRQSANERRRESEVPTVSSREPRFLARKSAGAEAVSSSEDATDGCKEKYEAMLRDASYKRVHEKASPRPTNFF